MVNHHSDITRIHPARLSTERLYTLTEIEALAKQWRDEHGFTSDDDAPWSVSHLLAWLAKREKEGGGDS